MESKENTMKYQDLVDHFIAQLEQGTCPWRKTWKGSNLGFALPLRHNGENYQGINILALWLAAQQKGFGSPYWMTFKQAKSLGACVRKGEKASFVFYVGQAEKERDGKAETFTFTKTYCVFNAEQIDGLPSEYLPAPMEAINLDDRNAKAEKFIANTGADIRHGGNSAFYARREDYVQLPEFAAFENAEAYYGTTLHELTHWTGSENRVERPKGKRFGDAAYAMEELVAELGAAFLCADLQISDKPRADHASYLAHWVEALKVSPKLLMSAASAATKATAYLHAQQSPNVKIKIAA